MKGRVYQHCSDLDYAEPGDRDEFHREALFRILQITDIGSRDEEQCKALDDGSFAGARDGTLLLKNFSAQSRTSALSARGRFSAGSEIGYATSGSSGPPRINFDSYDEVLHNSEFHGRGYLACGVRFSDTVGLLGEVGLFAGNYARIHALSFTGCRIVPLVDRNLVLQNCEIMKSLSVNVWSVMESETIPYLQLWEADGSIPRPPFRMILTGGERMGQRTRDRLRSIFGSATVVRSTYQSSDVGTIGYQCLFCLDNEYHVHEELQYIEVVDEHGEQTSSPGELVATNLFRVHSPTVRSRTGDIAEWASDQGRCACGRTSRKIRLLGRRARIFRIGSKLVDLNEFAELREVGFSIDSHLQVVLKVRDDSVERIVLHSNRELTELQKNSLLRRLEIILGREMGTGAGIKRGLEFQVGFREDREYRGFSKYIPVVVEEMAVAD